MERYNILYRTFCSCAVGHSKTSAKIFARYPMHDCPCTAVNTSQLLVAYYNLAFYHLASYRTGIYIAS